MAFKGGTRTPCLRQQGLTAGFAFANFHSSREAQTAETEHRGVNPSLSAMARPLLTLSSVLSPA
jgi:hypothetical protein